ncbi:MAG: twin-arginine translocase subunit TatC [Candidatus Omnitrophota bacterium]
MDQKKSFLEHLEELRRRTLVSLAVIAVLSAAAYSRSGYFLGLLAKPLGKLVFIAPQEAFLARIKISIFAGALISCPFLLYQAWMFVRDGLKENEKKRMGVYIPVSFVLFFVGAAFGYFVIIPIGLKFLLSYASPSLVPMISVSNCISFVGTLTIAFGVVFELPLAILFMTAIGVVTPRALAAKRRYAILFIFVAAAVFTPPDVVTQLFMAVPLVILYEISVALSRLVYRNSPDGYAE